MIMSRRISVFDFTPSVLIYCYQNGEAGRQAMAVQIPDGMVNNPTGVLALINRRMSLRSKCLSQVITW